jgi:hypothetical protein
MALDARFVLDAPQCAKRIKIDFWAVLAPHRGISARVLDGPPRRRNNLIYCKPAFQGARMALDARFVLGAIQCAKRIKIDFWAVLAPHRGVSARGALGAGSAAKRTIKGCGPLFGLACRILARRSFAI